MGVIAAQLDVSAVAACFGCARHSAVGRRCCVAAVDRGDRGHDAHGGARCGGDAGVGARFGGGGGTDREVRAERGAIASCGRMVGVGSPAPQPVALAPACGGVGVGRCGRGSARTGQADCLKHSEPSCYSGSSSGGALIRSFRQVASGTWAGVVVRRKSSSTARNRSASRQGRKCPAPSRISRRAPGIASAAR